MYIYFHKFNILKKVIISGMRVYVLKISLGSDIDMKIALISCTKKKKDYLCMASEMYSESTIFKYSYEYANLIADKIYILSAKYGLLPIYKIIEPYDLTFNNMKSKEVIEWGYKVIEQMGKEFDLIKDEFIILSGKIYYKELIGKINNYCIPLQHEDMYNRVPTLKRLIETQQNSNSDYKTDSYDNDVSNYSMKLHKFFNSCKIFDCSNIDEIEYENGIYIMFEEGELYGNLNRITRVGTHDEPNRLKKRLKNHFKSKNKDGSIFRKNIGRAMLNKSNDNYLDIWNKGTYDYENKKYVNKEKQLKIEEEVSKYIKNNIRFTVIRVDDDKLRLRLEKAIIATINKDDLFYSSENWLGNYSPEKKIKESGLWLKIGLEDEIITEKELKYIYKSLESNEKENRKYINASKSITNNDEVTSERDKKTSVDDIKVYINNILESARSKGKTECTIVSGDIHKQMNLKNKMPSVCSAMYKLKKYEDEILSTTPSGKSSTIKIKYYL